MLRSIYLIIIYFLFILLGFSAPFVFALGYIWVDTFTPQNIAYIILPDIPVSLIMALFTLIGYILFCEKKKQYSTPLIILTLIFGAWITASTFLWPVSPDAAFAKWNWAFKTVIFSTILPLIFNSRIKIESFLAVYLFSLSAQFLPVGLKTLISGGGYGRELGIVGGNSGFSEGATLSAVCFMMIPIAFYLKDNGIIIRKNLVTKLIYFGISFAAFASAIGTYERTALIGLAVVSVGMWIRSKKKIFSLIIGIFIIFGLLYFSSSTWQARMSTTSDYNKEASALGRILVWKWTLDFVSQHPEGGGFDTYRIDTIVFPGTPEHPEAEVVHGKAFHSTYFEVLGEQGVFGFFIFASMILLTFYYLSKSKKYAKNFPDFVWCYNLSYAMQISFSVLLTCGAVIGIGFQPMIYYSMAIAAAINNEVSNHKLANKKNKI